MYDPCTVAHEIKYPWRAHSRAYMRKRARDGASPWLLEVERKRRDSFITIWHVDPEKNARERGTRGDDTCGWFHPPTTPESRELVRKIGQETYRELWGRQRAEAEGADYAYVCYVPSAYDAVYWAWRRIKKELTGRGPWMFGEGRKPFLTAAELEEIYSLSASPIDNLRVTVDGVKGPEDCARFFATVHRCYVRHHRPWWQHPRWHFWHWRFQVHPWQAFKRWAFARCSDCKKGFRWGESVWGYGDARIFHDGCGGGGGPSQLVPNAATNQWEAKSS